MLSAGVVLLKGARPFRLLVHRGHSDYNTHSGVKPINLTDLCVYLVNAARPKDAQPMLLLVHEASLGENMQRTAHCTVFLTILMW
jgi:hypothetical protein